MAIKPVTKMGKMIFDKRRLLVLTREELAEKSGISTAAILHYEIKGVLPNTIILHKLCEALELDYDEAFDVLLEERNKRKQNRKK